MLETQCEGPADEPVNIVMVVHGPVLLHAIFGDACVVPQTTRFAKASKNAYASVTYAYAEGEIAARDARPTRWSIEVGKQMAQDLKTLELESRRGCTSLDLGSSEAWSYGDLIASAVKHRGLPRESPMCFRLGALPPGLMRQIWSELVNIASCASHPIGTYEPATLG